MKKQYHILSATICLITVFTSIQAAAATRTVCMNLYLQDGVRTNCSTASDTGARRPCAPAGSASPYVFGTGQVLELWDWESGDGSTDNFIGTFTYNNNGQVCASFDWESLPFSAGDSNPDLYVKMTNQAKPTNNTVGTVQVVDASGVKYGTVSWRDVSGCIAWNCSGTCSIGCGMLPTNDTASDYGHAVLLLDSAQHAYETFSGEIRSNTVSIEYPTARVCPWAAALNRSTICFPAGNLALEGDRAAHEVGHVIQMMQFYQDFLTDDCSWNGDGWTPNGIEWQSCATTEGWAMYAAIAAWWDPNNTGSVPRYANIDMEDRTPVNGTCSNNAWIPTQVTKAFWDLDDANNEIGAGITNGEDDVTNLNTLLMADAWDYFPDGTSNHQDGESDSNGVNARDYDYNWPVNEETFLRHNCIQSQVTD